MIAWTPADRNEFIERAVKASGDVVKGVKGNYWFNVMPKATGPEHDDENGKRGKATEALADTIYGFPEFRVISLKIHELLIHKINMSTQLSSFDISNIMVVVKGSNAYAMLLDMYTRDDDVKELFHFSDLDIVILINPNLPSECFNRIKSTMHTLVMQTMSQYKRTMDHMFFIDKPIQDAFLSSDVIMKFKEKFGEMLEKEDDEGGMFLSPFSNEQIRNSCSRNSFVILDSEGHEDSVVRVEVPHFDKCECIPLRKTPLFCSFNDTLEFNRSSDDKFVAKFNLYRLRMNVMYVSNKEDAREEKITADFVDISIADQSDSELKDFWENGRCTVVLDKTTRTWLSVPDIPTCAHDLYKMLHVFQCPESKRDKRQKKYDYLQSLIAK